MKAMSEITTIPNIAALDGPLVLVLRVVMTGLWLLLAYHALSLTMFALRTSLLASSTLFVVANILEICYRVWGVYLLVGDPTDIRLLFVVGQMSGAIFLLLILGHLREGKPLYFWTGAERRHPPPRPISPARAGSETHASTQ